MQVQSKISFYMLETEVHSELRSLLRNTRQPSWFHHLTMARLVARGLRLKKSTLIQTGVNRKQYYLSYLTPALLSSNSVILVTSNSIQKQLLTREIPQLQQALNTHKLITTNYHNFQGQKSALILISSEIWIREHLNFNSNLLNNIPTIIDEAENLEAEIKKCLTLRFSPSNWLELQQNFPDAQELIINTLIKLTSAIFSYPKNPYQSHLLNQQEKDIIANLFNTLNQQNKLPQHLDLFYRNYQEKNNLIYTQINRTQGQFTLISSPVEIKNKYTQKLWSTETILFISSYLESNKNAPLFCNSLGIESENITFLQFSNDAQNSLLKLYLPRNLPLPNTSNFKKASIREIMALIGAINQENKLIIILTNDVPLKSQFASHLAAQFGSKVILESENLLTLANNSILVCGWHFWQQNQDQLPSPQLIIVATLPIPSLENPLIAAKVSYYKNQGKDWFRDYLLPIAIKEMQTSLMSIRNEQGVVALLDNRVNFRSYGNTILKALEPFAKISYFDLSWFI